MRYYTAEEFKLSEQCKRELVNEYGVRIYALAFSKTKDEQAARGVVIKAFRRAFAMLTRFDQDGSDYWPLLERYALIEIDTLLAENETPVLHAKAGAPKAKNGKAYLLLALNILLLLVLLWVFLGLLIRLKALPPLPLGYAWFNQTFFPLF